MIRMGRSSKSEDTSKETTSLHEQSSTTAFPFENAAEKSAISESESMARDIKEGRLSGFVGAGTVLTGETNFQAMLRVDGHLTGKVTSDEGTLIVGSTGQVDANIDVATAMINGTVNGDVTATEKLELGRTARVVGDLNAPRLVVEDGAILEGSCRMVQSKENLETRLEEQRRQFSTNELSPVAEPEQTSFSEVTEEESTVEESFADETTTDEDEEEAADAATY